jgi:hypothetical protein
LGQCPKPSPPSALELLRDYKTKGLKARSISGVPSMYDSSEVKVFHQPDGGEG